MAPPAPLVGLGRVWSSRVVSFVCLPACLPLEPFASTYISGDSAMPPFPMRAACELLRDDALDDGALLAAAGAAVNLLFNASRAEVISRCRGTSRNNCDVTADPPLHRAARRGEIE